MNDTRGFAVEQGPDGLQHGPVSPESEAHGRFNAYTHLWCSIAHAEARPSGSHDPVDIALIAPRKDNAPDANLIIRYNLQVRTDISALCKQPLDDRTGAICRRIERRGVAH